MARGAAGADAVRRATAWLLIAALQLAPPGVALAAPEGEQVVSGSADFAREGDLTRITTYTPQTIVTWTSFDIAAGEAVWIDQPSELSKILNEVLSSDPTLVNGHLGSNGQVWIVNPVGVFFGDRAIVDVGGLVAAAGHVAREDFLAGESHFRDLAGRVEVASGAEIRAADSVLLVGETVANYGHIAAGEGMIALVAGGQVRLARVDGRVVVKADPALAPDPEAWALEQAGTLEAGRGEVRLSAGDAYSLALNHTGITRAREIEVAGGEGGLVALSGTLDASDAAAGATGGRIAVTGDRLLVGAARLDVSGDAGGGEILVGGEAHGGGETPTATRTWVSPDAVLRADALRTGDGGRIIVWADDATRFYGTLSARGGREGGDGGFAEISGARSLVSRGAIDLGAPAGEAGTLLYDPLRIVIQGGTADGTDADDVVSPETFLGADDGTVGRIAAGDTGTGVEPFVIFESEIEGIDANLVLQATQSIQTQGTFAAGDVVIASGRDVTMSVVDGGAPIGPGEIVGIDIRSHDGAGDLLWLLSNGGTLSLTTTASADRDADILVGAVQTSGVRAGTSDAVAIVTEGRGSIEVGRIVTSGADRSGPVEQIVFGTSVDTVAGGNVTVRAGTGSVTVGSVEARGGDASALEPGAGGAGGDVTIGALAGDVTVGSIDVSGGDGFGTSDVGGDPIGAQGGRGGAVSLSSASGDVRLAGGITSLGGAGVPDPDGGGTDPNESHGLAGAVQVTAAGDLDAAGAGDVRIQAGTVQLAAQNVFASGGGDLVLASAEDASPESFDGSATVQAAGDVRVLLDDADRFARFELIQTEATGTVDVLRGDGATVIARGDGAGAVHTIREITTGAGDPHLTYRLADTATGSDGAEQIDLATLAVDSGAVSFGASGGTIANARADATQPSGERLLGRIQGAGSGPHLSSAGGVQLFATHLGDETPLRVAAAQSLEVEVAGDVDLVADAGVALVDLVQRSAAGDIAIALPGGGGVVIEGTVVDDGATRTEASRITRLDTSSGPEFFFHLADPSASSGDAGTGEPVLTVASGAVTLGAAAGLATTGDLVLEGGPGPAVDAGGHTVVLVADSDRDGAGAIVASGSGVPDVANAGALVAFAGSGVGSEEAPLRTSAAGPRLALSGAGGSGDFWLVDDAGALSIERIPLTVANDGEREDVTFRGVHAGGDVVLDNGGREIALGAVQPDLPDETVYLRGDAPSVGLSGTEVGADLRYGFGGLTTPLALLAAADPATTTPHVVSGGSQRYAGAVSLANDRSFERTTVDPDTGDTATETVSLHEVVLRADGDVAFEGDVDTELALDPARPPGSLEVSAGGTITFAGDVGRDLGGTASVDALVLTDVAFSAGTHTVTIASGDFGRLDGPGTLALRGLGPGSQLVFRDDVGGRAALEAFDADADLLVFDARRDDGRTVSSADRITAGSVVLNTATPALAVPDAATIVDTSGGLAIASPGDVTVGANEKVSVVGPLAIAAGGTVAVGDLAATDLRVDAARIVIQGRAPGAVALPGGGSVQDGGVDWAANNIATHVVPEWDGVAAPPTFVLGSGGIRTGGEIPFDVIRFTAGSHEIDAASFAGAGRVLDLTGLGPRVVSDPTDDVPRAAPPVEPGLEPRFSETPPVPPPPPQEQEVLGAVRCRAPDGGLCPAPATAGPLADERSREIVQRYHGLVASARGRQRLVAAFDPVARAGLVRAGDGRALYRALGAEPAFADARERLHELAVVLAEVSLLGLDDPGTERVRRAVAGDFAAATGVPGLDADAALAAVAASGVGALPGNAD